MPATPSFKCFSADVTAFVFLVFTEKKLPIETKYVK
jgi:hypothetical protein